MKQYIDLVDKIMKDGVDKEDRTGTGTRSWFGPQIEFDLKESFPIVTVKRTYWKGVVHELLWFLKGSTNIKYLVDNNVHIWDEWADDKGELGPVYGKQWRNWDGVDQIKKVVDTLKANPDSRRNLVSAWNITDLPRMALEPCHTMFQFYVANGELSCKLYQRSADTFLGVPFNIASYALLTHMIAHVTGLGVGRFIHTFGDAHIYRNHFEQVALMMNRKPVEPTPYITLNPDVKNIDGFKYDDIALHWYNPHPTIKADVSV